MNKFNEAIRNLGFVSWKDPDAWMEPMKGTKWTNALKNEKKNADLYLKEVSIQKKVKKYKEIFNNLNKENGYTFHSGPIAIHLFNDFILNWHWLGSKDIYQARDIFSNVEGNTWVIRDVGKGSERLRLDFLCEPYDETPTWSVEPVGSRVGILGSHCFYLTMENKLWYNKLWRCDALTGKNRICIYEEKNKSINLDLSRKPNKKLIFSREMNQDYTYYQIEADTGKVLHQVKSEYSIPHSWILPLGQYGIVFVWTENNLLITRQYGRQILWRCSSSISPKKLIDIPGGSILLDPWATWANNLPCTVIVNHPSEGSIIYLLDKTSISILQKQPSNNLIHKKVVAVSYDGKEVHSLAVFKRDSTVKKLMVIGYGAYGLPTGFGSVLTHWAPLLEENWCIACVFIRGGGDHTEEWGKAGRRGGRWNTFADFESGIRMLQYTFNVKASHTAIYGRSAGGLLVGSVLGHNPTGSLMSCVYTEVPYVDVLRTTTNLSLPLTKLEYDEFGNPRGRIEDLIDVGLMSPADLAVGLKTPDIFVLARSAVNDSEVYAYEPLKWITRLREGSPIGAPKVLCMENNQGHFTPPESQTEQYSNDLALIDSWMEGALKKSQYKV